MALIQRNDERFRAVIKSGKIVAPYYSPRGAGGDTSRRCR
jgi:pyruvate dehydrogenase E1 component alpha subunit